MSEFSLPFFFGGKTEKTNQPILQVLKTDYYLMACKEAMQRASQGSLLEYSQDCFVVGTRGNSTTLASRGLLPHPRVWDYPAVLASGRSPADSHVTQPWRGAILDLLERYLQLKSNGQKYGPSTRVTAVLDQGRG